MLAGRPDASHSGNRAKSSRAIAESGRDVGRHFLGGSGGKVGVGLGIQQLHVQVGLQVGNCFGQPCVRVGDEHGRVLQGSRIQGDAGTIQGGIDTVQSGECGCDVGRHPAGHRAGCVVADAGFPQLPGDVLGQPAVGVRTGHGGVLQGGPTAPAGQGAIGRLPAQGGAARGQNDRPEIRGDPALDTLHLHRVPCRGYGHCRWASWYLRWLVIRSPAFLKHATFLAQPFP